MYEDDVDFGIGMSVDFSDFEAFDFLEIDCGALHATSSLAMLLGIPLITSKAMGSYHACALFSTISFIRALCQPGTVRALYTSLQRLLRICHDPGYTRVVKGQK